ncbi:type 4 pilus major pilin [Leptothrix sp. BB-4]
MPRISFSKSQLGLSLLELSIALAIASVGVILALRKESADLQYKHLQYESAWVVGVLKDIESARGQNGDRYSKLTNLIFGTLNSIPPAYLDTSVVGVTVVKNGFSGNVYVAPMSLDGVENAYALTYTAVPRDVCAKFVMMLHTGANEAAPAFGIVGENGVSTQVPSVELGVLTGPKPAPTGMKVLKYAGQTDVKLNNLADFCDVSTAGANSLVSLTIIRRP